MTPVPGFRNKGMNMRHRLIFLAGSLIVLAVVSAQASAQTFTTLYSFDRSHGIWK